MTNASPQESRQKDRPCRRSQIFVDLLPNEDYHAPHGYPLTIDTGNGQAQGVVYEVIHRGEVESADRGAGRPGGIPQGSQPH